MAARKTSKKAENGPGSKAKPAGQPLRPQKIAALQKFDPATAEGPPQWVPEPYRQAHHHDEETIVGVRETEHLGRAILIETTYKITVNGQSLALHAVLGQDGRIRSHLCPYFRFVSAVDFVKAIIELYPDCIEQRGVDSERPSSYHLRLETAHGGARAGHSPSHVETGGHHHHHE